MTNPYAPPSAPVNGLPADVDATAERAAHIFVEEWIRAIGSGLFALGAMGAAVVALLFVASSGSAHPLPVTPAALFVSSAGVVGWLLRRLHPLGRIAATLGAVAFAVMSLLDNGGHWTSFSETPRALVVVVPTVAFALHVPWMLWNRAGRRIFSAEYRSLIRPATPGVRAPWARACVAGIAGVVLVLSIFA